MRPRRIVEIGLPPIATGLGFWGLQRLDLLADTPLVVLIGLLSAALIASEIARTAARSAYRLRTTIMVAAAGAVIYATGWGPILAVGFMYGIAAPVRSFGSRAAPTAFISVTLAIFLGQVAVAVGVAPTLLEERLAHGLAVLAYLGLTFPSWAIYRTAAEKEASEDELVHRATHDALTRLPNRPLFIDRLKRALVAAREQRTRLAVLFVDLDRFKVVNDSLGHEIGDLVLGGVAQRIEQCTRPADTVARLGGDEFTVLVTGIEGEAEAVQVAERILEELELPFVLEGFEVVSSASIGIALSDASTTPAEALMRESDVAMYQAKRRGGSQYQVYDAEMGARARRRLELEGRLRRAIDEREFELFYQPEVSLRTGSVVGAEALVRWIDPDAGAVPLEDVIPIAEETGLIVPLGRWVLEQGCRDARRWFEGFDADRPGVVALNISPRQLQHADLVAHVSAVLGAARLDPARTRLEITESAVMQDAQRGLALVRELKDLGVQIALDDFGTGHSSLSSLRNLPADVLKLDRSFIIGLDGDETMLAIIDAVTKMAHELGIEVVAEGVETVEQLRVLRQLGCDTCQGYLFSPPVPDSEAITLVRAGEFPIDDLVAGAG